MFFVFSWVARSSSKNIINVLCFGSMCKLSHWLFLFFDWLLAHFHGFSDGGLSDGLSPEGPMFFPIMVFTTIALAVATNCLPLCWLLSRCDTMEQDCNGSWVLREERCGGIQLGQSSVGRGASSWGKHVEALESRVKKWTVEWVG